MPKIIIVPHYQYENEFGAFLEKVNSVQADFQFYLWPPSEDKDSPLNSSNVDFLVGLKYLDKRKKMFGLEEEDLLIAFYDGVLSAIDHGLSNLFIAGSSLGEPYPRNAVISLQFIQWGLLEKKFDYSLQRHALFHLVVCCVIAGYTSIRAHHDTYGCLLDFNNHLYDFNRKLQMGYYLCSVQQQGCHESIKNSRYGSSILRLCSSLRNTIDQNSLRVIIEELNMDTYNVGQAGAVGRNAKAENITFNQVQADNDTKLDLVRLAHELEQLRHEMVANADKPEQFIEIGVVAEAETSAKQGDESKVVQVLAKVGRWSLDTATAIGTHTAAKAIKLSLGM